jgi:zinc-ribbon domain
MAVELRCPECRAKLRLPTAPEEGSEVECPKCGHVFAAELAGAAARAREETDEPRPRKKPAEDVAEKPPKPKKKKAPAGQGTPRKRLLKKRKNNPYVLYGAIGGGVLLLGVFLGAVLWFFNRQSASQEMMLYLPDDCDEVSGINLGHLQKYPEFYTNSKTSFANTGFKKAADQFSKALGQETDETITYVVQGEGNGLGATVLRTKEEFDTGLLSRLPNAKKGTRNGVDYYVIDDIPELGYGGIKVFAPTNRIVVFTRFDTPDNKFDAMLTGHAGSPDATPFARSGQLGKQVVRGTAWKFMIYGRSVTKLTMPAQASGGSESDEDMLKREIAEILANAKGCGYKASVGSREVRGEFVVWYKDSDEANGMLKKWREKEWVQDEEKDPPKSLKALASESGGGKTAVNVIRDGFALRQSGETFIMRTAMDVNLLKSGVSSLVSAFNPINNPSGGGGQSGMGGRPRPDGGPRRRRLLALRG